MRDAFGTDGIQTEGAGTASMSMPDMAAGTGGMTATAPSPTTSAAVTAATTAATPVAPTLQQAVDKAVAKAGAEAKVNADPHAVLHVKLAPAAPIVLGSAAAGALLGSAILPGPGTLIGAGVGWLAERYQIGGGPVGRLWSWTKKKVPVLQKGETSLKSGLHKATGV